MPKKRDRSELSSRDARFDNLKFVLISLVVFGHLLELIAGKTFSEDLYRAIYAFHMPAFIFVSGYFAKFSPKRIVLNLAWVYLLFQILYIAFDRSLFGSELPFQVMTPYWLMWYMLVMVFCYMMVPLIASARSVASRTIVLSIAVAISMIAGYDDDIGRFLSLSRLFTFFPYFVAGYYVAHSRHTFDEMAGAKRVVTIIVSGALSVVAIAFVVCIPEITPSVLYGASSYASAGYGPAMKASLLPVAAVAIAFLVSIMPKRRIPILTTVGANTLSVYILHGFVVKAIAVMGIFSYGEVENLLIAAALAVSATLVLGSKPVAWVFNWVGTGRWLDRVMSACSGRICAS